MSLRKPGRETDQDILTYLNSFSPSMCLAKWYNATIWLGSGMTTSCHHPPAHKVDADIVVNNPRALHNTPQKKQDRQQMQQGIRPSGCEYCWKIEDIKRDNISDRVYKSMIYNDPDAEYASQLDCNTDVNLKTLEIAFDRTCQLACSYCNPAFSTTWVQDIKSNGAYENLISDGRNHFTHAHDSAQLYKPNETNPYVEAFFKWWDLDLHQTLQELRLTGGEPLMSAHTKRLLNWFISNKSTVSFALNSNLCVEEKHITRLIAASHNIQNFHLYTSNESMRDHAEYIRDGLSWKQWTANIERILENGKIDGFHMMCTINALCLESLTEFLDYCLELKQKYNKNPTFTLNILRFPSFQSPLVLPNELRTKYKNELQLWLDKNKYSSLIQVMELNQVQRLIDYLDVVKTPHSETFDMPALHNDFKQFYQQYDQRRNKNLTNTFKTIGSWYQTL